MNYSDKQVQILSTAEQLFSSKGFDGTSVRDIAEEAGVNIAMISYYFGSKEKLMEALFEQRSSNVKFWVDNLLQDDSISPLQKMYNLAEDFLDKIMDKQQFFKIMICEQIINKNPVIIGLVKDLKIKNAAEIERIITDGQKKGVFKKDIDVLISINTLFGLATQMIISKDYYREYNALQSMPDEEFNDLLKQKLIGHVKVIFKALLSYEA